MPWLFCGGVGGRFIGCGKCSGGFFSSPSAVDSVNQGTLELCRGFTQFQFSHKKRQGNMPAHLIAKNAYSIFNDIVWVEEDPCFAKQALIHDVKFMFS